MTLAPFDLQGWKAIADALGVSVDTARRYATTGEDPMPAYRFMGSVRARSTEIEAWAERQTRGPAKEGE